MDHNSNRKSSWHPKIRVADYVGQVDQVPLKPLGKFVIDDNLTRKPKYNIII